MKPSGISEEELDGTRPAGAARAVSGELRTVASRVVPVGASGVVRQVSEPHIGVRRDTSIHDDVTTVDGAFEPLTKEQRAALARRIRSELEQTRPIGTPPPGPVEPSKPAPSERAPAHSFKQTMLLGVARTASSAPPPAPPATATPVAEPPSSLRASFVRVVGPPTSPPPRRPRRTEPPTAPERSSPAVARVTEGEPDHEAFELDRKSSANLTMTPVSSAAGATDRISAVMLPPSPQAGGHQSAMPPPFPPAVIGPGLGQSGTMPRSAHPSDAFGGLPSVDPFAGFVARRPSLLERWLVVLVVALALVGAAALGAIALGYLGRPGL